MPVPSMGDSITEGTIAEWHVAVDDYVNVDDVVVSIETDKVMVEVRATEAGYVTSLSADVDETVEVGAPLLTITPGEPPAGGAPAPAPAPVAAAPSPAPAAAPSPAPAPAPSPAPAPAPSPAPAPASGSGEAATGINVSSVQRAKEGPASLQGSRTETRVKMTRMRSRIAQRLKDAQNEAAMLTTFQEVDMSALINLRKQHKDAFAEKHGVKLGFMSAFIKASAGALQNCPAVNAVIDGGDIVYRDYVDVSVAVASPRGLVVPVLRNVESKSMATVEAELAELAKKARADEISLEDMAGGTFTISNGGVFGSMMGTPIINPPQSAILGMHATKMRPVAVDGKVEIRPVMYLALTYDHRLIDGREAVTTLCDIRDKIEDPARMLLDL